MRGTRRQLTPFNPIPASLVVFLGLVQPGPKPTTLAVLSQTSGRPSGQAVVIWLLSKYR
jgi:hypothetical protein